MITFFNLVMVTLVELGAVFWVGAQLWLNFVLQPTSERYKEEEKDSNARVERRFERLFSLPILLVLLLANIGVLIGRAYATSGDWGQAFSANVLTELATTGRFGAFWLMREVVILLAIAIAVYMLLNQSRPKPVTMLLPLVNLLLGTALFIAITMSSHATAVSNNNLLPYAIIVDWLHLLASALWVGGMFYIATIYLPVLKKQGTLISARSLTRLLPYSFILAIAGIIIMAVTGPFSASFQLSSWSQLTDTAYGRTLLVKIVLVAGLLVTTAIQAGLLRPHVKKEYKKYSYAAARLAALVPAEALEQQAAPAAVAAQQNTTESASSQVSGRQPGQPTTTPTDITAASAGQSTRRLAQQVRLRERRLESKTRRLTSLLRWEPLLGLAIIVCVGLLDAFGGTLIPGAAAQQHPGGKPQIFSQTVPTQDGKYKATLEVNPNHFGTNVFTVSVVDTATGKPVTNVGVVLFTTMLDMDMGTQSINLVPDGKGHFSASGELSMAGDWQIRIAIRTPDGILHEATVKLTTPF